jgi:hypothetical protein
MLSNLENLANRNILGDIHMAIIIGSLVFAILSMVAILVMSEILGIMGIMVISDLSWFIFLPV